MLSRKEQQTMLKIRSLLYNMCYFIKDDHIKIVEEYHELCRKYCPMYMTKHTTKH